jgi:hypothetical protein
MDGFRWTAIADGPRRTGQPSASVGRPWRTASAASGRPPRRTSVGSSDASGRPPDVAVDVRTRDNPEDIRTASKNYKTSSIQFLLQLLISSRNLFLPPPSQLTIPKQVSYLGVHTLVYLGFSKPCANLRLHCALSSANLESFFQK